MWKDLAKPWQECFNQAWEAYCSGSIPIGAVLEDDKGNIIYRGRNRIFENQAPEKQICSNNLSHAEMNTLLQINRQEHPYIRSYTLYTTMEPCPLCFGAAVMANIRKIAFAARDGYAGSTNLSKASEYISGKNIQITGPFYEMEAVQLLIQTVFELISRGKLDDRILNVWRRDCPEAIELSYKWFDEGKLLDFKNKGEQFSVVYDSIVEELNTQKERTI